MTPDDRLDPSQRQLLDLASYSRAIKRRWPVVLILAVLGATAGWAAAGARSPSYEASTLLTVNAGLVSYTSTANDVKPNMATEQQIAKSTLVIGLAADALGDTTVAQFQPHARAAAAADANTLVLTFTAATPERAQLGSTVWADAYLADRGRRSDEGVTKARNQIQDRVESQAAALIVAQQELAVAEPNSTAERLADVKVSLLEQQQANLQSQLDALSLLVTDPGEVVSSASLPRNPEGLPDSTIIVAGLLIGVLLGITFAVMIERRRGVVRSAAEARERAGVPVVLLANDYPPDALTDPGVEALSARVESAAAGSSYLLVISDVDARTAEPLAEPLATALSFDGATVAVGAGRRAIADDGTIRIVVAPGSSSAGARSTMSRADGVLLVVRLGRTTMRSFGAAVDAIHDADAAMLAVAVIDSKVPTLEWPRGAGQASPSLPNSWVADTVPDPLTQSKSRRSRDDPSTEATTSEATSTEATMSEASHVDRSSQSQGGLHAVTRRTVEDR